MRKLKSFTMMELMISLLISGIVVSISYYALLFFNRQFLRYRQTSAKLNSFLLFKKAIRSDFERSPMILDAAAGSVFSSAAGGARAGIIFYDSSLTRTAEYIVDSNFIIRRTAASVDTFSTGGRIQSIRHVSDSLPLVTSFLLDTRMHDDTIGTLVVKDYTAGELMAAERFMVTERSMTPRPDNQ